MIPLPLDLLDAIEALVQKIPPSTLRKAQEALSDTYRKRGTSHSIFKHEAQSLSYLVTRLPATYAAVAQVLTRVDIPCKHWLDLGAGPGTASLAAIHSLPNIEKITLIEQNAEAIALGKHLGTLYPIFQHAEWIHRSLPCPLPEADVAILSYSLGELESPAKVIEDWWNSNISFLIIIEPGTPIGFHKIEKIRQRLISLGAHLLAPCPHSLACPMKSNDWCHFSVRIERSRLHRYLKEGELGYEDEKYSYLVAGRKSGGTAQHARVLRHPQKHSGFVRLSLCDLDGQSKEKIVTKKDRQLYRKARDIQCGDLF
jgi:ribosomal protein RSM22 (predicted rRNA methylase)